MKNKELFKLVLEEATKLRDAITLEEASKLNAKYVDPDNTQFCIYGQLAGTCKNKRAISLIKRCAAKVYVIPREDADVFIDTDDGDRLRTSYMYSTSAVRVKGFDYDTLLNGNPNEVKDFNSENNWRTIEHYSPIETYICMCGKGKIAELVAYIKKETNTFNPEILVENEN